MTVSSSVSGAANTVIQILGDGNAASMTGATTELMLKEYRQASFSAAPADPDMASKAGWTRSGRRETRILSAYNRESLRFLGRSELFDTFKGWVLGEGQLSVHALVGGGGSGKTRLAVELIDWAREKGWTAGFALGDGLDVFQRSGCRTAQDGPCLVVVDYASAKLKPLAAWLRALVHQEDNTAPLRLLLLERTGGSETAWWRQLFEQGGPDGKAIADLLSTGAPETLTPLSTPEERHAVFAAAFVQATDEFVPPRSPSLDHTLADVSLGGEPLFLAMFALVAARQGLDDAAQMTADQIAMDLARQEIRRIGQIWASKSDLPQGGERPLHQHLAALVTLSEGWTDEEAHAAIEQEVNALHLSLPTGTEAVRSVLHRALPGEGGGISAVLPNILGEAVAIEALGRLPDKGVGAIRRVAAADRRAITASVIRACQDYLIRGERQPMDWLNALKADAVELDPLLALVQAMPVDTLELREIAAELTESALSLARDLPADEGIPVVSLLLNNLSIRLDALGRREEALAAREEAVAIRRELAIQLRAISNHANCRDYIKRNNHTEHIFFSKNIDNTTKPLFKRIESLGQANWGTLAIITAVVALIGRGFIAAPTKNIEIPGEFSELSTEAPPATVSSPIDLGDDIISIATPKMVIVPSGSAIINNSKVHIPEFEISATEVLNKEFNVFLESCEHAYIEDEFCEFAEDQPTGYASDDSPKVMVTWEEASAYTRWLTEVSNSQYIYRLVTNSEWDYILQEKFPEIMYIKHDDKAELTQSCVSETQRCEVSMRDPSDNRRHLRAISSEDEAEYLSFRIAREAR